MQLLRNTVSGMSILILVTEFMVLSPVLHPNRHPIKRFDLISTDTCLDFPCTFCLKLTQAITWKVSFMKQVCLKLLVWLLQFSFLLKWHEMFQITIQRPLKMMDCFLGYLSAANRQKFTAKVQIWTCMSSWIGLRMALFSQCQCQMQVAWGSCVWAQVSENTHLVKGTKVQNCTNSTTLVHS